MRHAVVLPVFAMLSCATTFSGSAKVPNGVEGCKARCSSYGMELIGMVALGDYSDGCICEVPGRRAAVSGGVASGAAAAAVMEAMRQRARQADREHLYPEPIFPPPMSMPPGMMPPLVRDERVEDARCAAVAGATASHPL
jgi:hypothetical protein